MQPRPEQGVSLQFWAPLASYRPHLWESLHGSEDPVLHREQLPSNPLLLTQKHPKAANPSHGLQFCLQGWWDDACLLWPFSCSLHLPVCPFPASPLPQKRIFWQLKFYSAGRPRCRKEGCWVLWGGMALPSSQQVLSPIGKAHLLHCCTNSFLSSVELMVFSSTPAHRVKQLTLPNADAHNPCTKQQRYSACSLPSLLSNAPSRSKLLIRGY